MNQTHFDATVERTNTCKTMDKLAAEVYDQIRKYSEPPFNVLGDTIDFGTVTPKVLEDLIDIGQRQNQIYIELAYLRRAIAAMLYKCEHCQKTSSVDLTSLKPANQKDLANFGLAAGAAKRRRQNIAKRKRKEREAAIAALETQTSHANVTTFRRQDYDRNGNQTHHYVQEWDNSLQQPVTKRKRLQPKSTQPSPLPIAKQPSALPNALNEPPQPPSPPQPATATNNNKEDEGETTQSYSDYDEDGNKIGETYRYAVTILSQPPPQPPPPPQPEADETDDAGNGDQINPYTYNGLSSQVMEDNDCDENDDDNN